MTQHELEIGKLIHEGAADDDLAARQVILVDTDGRQRGRRYAAGALLAAIVVGLVLLLPGGQHSSANTRGVVALESQPKSSDLGSKAKDDDDDDDATKAPHTTKAPVVVKDDVKQTTKAPELKDKFAACSAGKDNCNATECCHAPGMQCYQQNKFYAQCKETCTSGPDPTHWDGQFWTCKALGKRTPGDASCSAPGQDCRSTKCCTAVNTQCFEKNDGWATCKSECVAGGPDMSDANGDPWTCKKLGPWTPGAAPWVAEQCAMDGQDCSKKQCCKTPGAQCYQQSAYWSQCKPGCTPGQNPERGWEPAWSCNKTGTRTPASAPVSEGKVASWVKNTCAGSAEDCTNSRCCLGADMQCFQKNDKWATCMEDCSAGRHVEDNNETWSCKPLGPRSHGLALKGFPSLFCWSLIQTTTYEFDIIKFQMSKDAGIFGCDQYAVLSTDNVTELGKNVDGETISTLQVPTAPITRSVDGTAGNAKLFMNCWDVIIKDGRFRNHAWTLKVDPDAVMVAPRVRSHMAPHFGENVYIVNCNKFPSSPNFPMMYGALEIYSFKAIDVYARRKSLCLTDMGMMLPSWGEDYFMTHCLDHIGVGRIADFGSLGDMNCLGANCGDKWTASFHPFKDVKLWEKCWNTATR